MAQYPANVAATIVDGGSVTLGAKADTAWVSGVGTVVSVLKGIFGLLSGTGIIKTKPSGASFLQVAGLATTAVKASAGVVRSISVTKAGSAGSLLTVYDSLAGSGTVIAVIDGTVVQTVTLGAAFATGLTIVSAVAAANFTVVFD